MSVRKSSKKSVQSPIRVGNPVLIRTVTQYHVGRIELITKDEIVLSDASWIADTGRFSTALQTGTVNESEPFSGPVSVSRGSIVDVVSWSHPIPISLK